MNSIGNWILSAADLSTDAQRQQYLASAHLDTKISEILNSAKELTKPVLRQKVPQNSDSMIIDSDDSEAGCPNATIRYLEHPQVILSSRSRYHQANETDKDVELFRKLDLWLVSHNLLQIKPLVSRRPAVYFFHPERPNGGWQFENVLQMDEDALRNPLSIHTSLDFSGDPRLKWRVSALQNRKK